MKYLFNSINLFINMEIKMSLEKQKHYHHQMMKESNENIKSTKKDVVERFLSILWKKEVDYKVSLK